MIFQTSGLGSLIYDCFDGQRCWTFCFARSLLLAILQVLVYAGAVMVLFLFIIMLLDVGPEGSKSSRIKMISVLPELPVFQF